MGARTGGEGDAGSQILVFPATEHAGVSFTLKLIVMDEFADNLRHGFLTQAQASAKAIGFAQAQILQFLRRRILRGGIAHQVDALFGHP